MPPLPGLSNGHTRCQFLLESRYRCHLLFFYCQFLGRCLFGHWAMGWYHGAWVVVVPDSVSGCWGGKWGKPGHSSVEGQFGNGPFAPTPTARGRVQPSQGQTGLRAALRGPRQGPPAGGQDRGGAGGHWAWGRGHSLQGPGQAAALGRGGQEQGGCEWEAAVEGETRWGSS